MKTNSKTVQFAALAAALLVAGTVYAQRPTGARPTGGQQPAEVQACVALQVPDEIRACLMALREGSQRPPAAGRPGGEQALLRFLTGEYLGLSEEQRSAAMEIRRSFAESMAAVRGPIVENFRAIQEAARNGQPTDTLVEEQGRLMGEALKVMLAQRAASRAALNLTPDQEDKLDRLMELKPQGGPGLGGPPEGAAFGPLP